MLMCYNSNGFWGHLIKWDKLVTKSKCAIICLRCQEYSNSQINEIKQWLPGLEGDLDMQVYRIKERWRVFVTMWRYLKLATQLYAYRSQLPRFWEVLWPTGWRGSYPRSEERPRILGFHTLHPEKCVREQKGEDWEESSRSFNWGRLLRVTRVPTQTSKTSSFPERSHFADVLSFLLPPSRLKISQLALYTHHFNMKRTAPTVECIYVLWENACHPIFSPDWCRHQDTSTPWY
jgi:hypothetical protein